MATVTIQNRYPVPPERLWDLVTDYDALRVVMQGIASFEGLPSGKAQTGQKLNVSVSLFGKLPGQPYFMEVLECDDTRMILRSSERGAGVKEWRHTLTVTETQDGSLLTDRIEIDAGWLTPLFAMWARYLYGARHKPRLRLLESGAFSTVEPDKREADKKVDPDEPKPIRIAAAIIRNDTGHNLLVRKKGTRAFMQAGGKIEPGEDTATALRREIAEELGVAITRSAFVGSFVAPAANEDNHMVHAEVFTAELASPPVTGAEIEEILWITRNGLERDDIAPLSRLLLEQDLPT